MADTKKGYLGGQERAGEKNKKKNQPPNNQITMYVHLYLVHYLQK